MTSLLSRCATCRRHLRTRPTSCPFCEKHSSTAKSAAFAAALMAFAPSAAARVDDSRVEFIVPSANASPAQNEPMYGISPRPRPEPPPEDEPEPPPEEEPAPPSDDESKRAVASE